MCSVSDIPIVGKAVDKISEVIVEAGTRGIGYLFCYKGLVYDLKTILSSRSWKFRRKILQEKQL